MIPNAKVRQVHSRSKASAGFGISLKDEAHIMAILRDTLYSDKVLAVLREYSANAWDANRQAGRGQDPIEVHLPTAEEPWLKIRDRGPGLSHEDVFGVYTQYGSSTKRDTNEAVGMLGIGSKSGFAYADTFTVTSWNGGTKRVYACVLDASDKGEIKLLNQSICGEETGIEVQIQVKPDDVGEFYSKACSLYRYFEPQPKCNVELPRPQEAVMAGVSCGGIYGKDGSGWVAVMGCVPYRVNLDQLAEHPDFDGEALNQLGGFVRFGIGDVQVNASREELKYGDATKDALVAKFNDLVAEYVSRAMTEIQSSGVCPWEKRLKAQVLSELGIPVPKDHKELFARWVTIKVPPKTFTLYRHGSVASNVNVEKGTKLLLQQPDDRRRLAGYQFEQEDHVVRPVTGCTLEEVRAELDKVLADHDLTGCPIGFLATERVWYPKRRNYQANRPKDVKHSLHSFKIADKVSSFRPYSKNWDAETEREPTDSDVYVVLAEFQPVGLYGFYNDYALDRVIGGLFGIPVPTVYGYKSTAKKRVDESKLKGRSYSEWRKDFFKELRSSHVYAAQLPDTTIGEDDLTDDEEDDGDEAEWKEALDTVPEEKPTLGKIAKRWAKLQAMDAAELLLQPIEKLRQYAGKALKLVGASKIRGGKVRLVERILQVRA